MKQSLTCLLILLTLVGFSQTVPLRINYQAVPRSANGDPMANYTVSLKFEILQGSASGAVVYTETQNNVACNALGLLNTQIGKNASLAGINWGGSDHFLRTGIDTLNGSAFITLGTQQLVSVPYALHAETAASAPSPTLSVVSGPGGNVLNVGSSSVTLPASSSSQSTSIITSGAIGSTLTGNTYNLDVPLTAISPTWASGIAPTATAGGLAQVIGTYPNFTVLVAPVIGYDPSVGTLSLSSAPGIPSSYQYSYSYNITPSLSLNGSTLSVGPPTNSVALPGLSGGTASLVSSGAAVTTTLSANSYSIHVPAAGITSSNNSASITPVGTNSFDISVPALTVTTSGGGITQGGIYPNLTLNSPSVNVVAAALGLAQVNGTYPNYTISVAPTFSYTNSTGSLVVSNPGNGQSFSVNVTPALAFNAGTGVLTSGPAGNSVTLPTAVTPSIAGAGAATVNPASGNSFTVNVAPTSVISSNNSATVTPVGTNSFDISVPAEVAINTAGGAGIAGSYPNFTISAPPQVTLTSSGTGNAIVTNTAVNAFNVSVPAVTLTPSGGGITSVSGAYPNLTLNSPSVAIGTNFFVLPSILQKAGSYPNYSLYVSPNIGYSSATGSLTLQSYAGTSPTYAVSYNITPALTSTNNIIQSGPNSNTVAITSPAAQAFAISGNSVTIGTSFANIFSTGFTKQIAGSEIDVFAHLEVNAGIIAGGSHFVFEITVDGSTSPVAIPHVLTPSNQSYITLKSVFSGLSPGPHTVGVAVRTNAGVGTAVSYDPNGYGAKLILKETY